MRRSELLEVLRAQPFEPFRIFVSDGAAYTILHPDIVLVAPTSAIVGTAEGDQRGPAIERFNIVALDHVTRLEKIEVPTSAA